MDITNRADARFTAMYSNVAFGWDIATAFAAARVPFPVTVVGRDTWLFKAYMFRLNSHKWDCPEIVDAWALANLPKARMLKTKVCSLLLSGCGQPPDAHRRAVSEATNIPLRTLEAFDVLFYNILDRHKDAAYISEHVYPNTRFVELADDYVKHTDISDLVKRAGYNYRNLKMSTFMTGIGDASFMAKLSARADREQELTRHLMGNALLLVHAGALNHRSVGIQRAQTLIAATRQSGQTAEAPTIADAGSYIADELASAISTQNEQRVRIAVDDAGGNVE